MDVYSVRAYATHLSALYRKRKYSVTLFVYEQPLYDPIFFYSLHHTCIPTPLEL
jgi:hypothetical protein